MNRYQAVIFLQNVLACYCGNSLASFGLTETKNAQGKTVNYGFFIKENPSSNNFRSRECFAERNNLEVVEQDGLIVYKSK